MQDYTNPMYISIPVRSEIGKHLLGLSNLFEDRLYLGNCRDLYFFLCVCLHFKFPAPRMHDCYIAHVFVHYDELLGIVTISSLATLIPPWSGKYQVACHALAVKAQLS